jgi:hypothetical protein
MSAVAPIETTATASIFQIPNSPYKLRKPLLVEIEQDDAGFVVSEPSTGVFHYDKDLGAAFSGFLRVFVNEFEYLRKQEQNLSPALTAELERFTQVFAV